MNAKKFGFFGAAAASIQALGGCADAPVSQTALAPAAPAQSSPIMRSAPNAAPPAPELSAAIFDDDPRFDDNSKNDETAPRTAWSGGYLVRAVVVETRPFNGGNVQRGVLQITHVYSGPQKLVGQNFSALSSKGLSSLAAITWPQLKLDEQSVWSLSKNRHPISSRTIIDREIAASGLWKSRLNFALGEFTPATDEKRAQLLAAAEALAVPVERVERAAPAEQETLLREYALDANSAVYAWATEILMRWKPTGIASFFEQNLRAQTLPIPQQVFFDRALVAVADQSWPHSVQRREIWQRWVKADLPKKDAEAVQYRLFFTTYNGELDAKEALALYKTLLLNAPIADWKSSMVHGQLGRLAGEKKLPRHDVFHFLLHQIQHAPNLDTKLAAASVLGGGLLSPSEITAIKAARQNAENQLLKGFLQVALDSSAKADEAQRRKAKS